MADGRDPEPARTRPGYLPALDGLRAVSVAAVIAYHLGRLGGGFLGVDVFFVISGFLITRLLLAEWERTGSVSLAAFWGRRFRRLLPALLVLLVAVAGASRWMLPAWRLGDIRNDALSALGYVANWRFIASGQSYFAQGVGPSPLRHTWSLAIEEQFYLLWPLAVVGLAAVAGRRVRLAVLTVAGVGALVSAGWMAVAAGDGDLTRLYYGTDTRLFALLGGAWLAAWWDPVVADGPRHHRLDRPRPISRMGLIGVVPLLGAFAIGVEDEAWFYRGGFQAVTVLSVVAVIGLATGEGWLARALGSAVPRWIGRRSYGIYLWSWPVQIFSLEHFGLDGWVLDVVVVVLSLGLAALSFRFVEEPIRTGRLSLGGARESGRRALPSPRRGPAVARSGVAIGAVAAVIFASAAGAPPAPDYLTVTDDQAVAAALDSRADFGGEAPGARRRSEAVDSSVSAPTPTTASGEATPITEPAVPGPFDWRAPIVIDPDAGDDPHAVYGRPLRVLIAGDSVGWSLGWELGSDLNPGVLVADRAIIGCGLMPHDAKWIVGDGEAEDYALQCEYQAQAEQLGLDSGPDVVLLWVGAWEVYDHVYQGQRYDVGEQAYEDLLELRLQAEIDKFRAQGVPTIMPVVPCFGRNADRLGQERYDESRIAWVNERLRAVAERNRGWVRMVDPTDQLCTPEGHPRSENPDGHPIRADGAHFDQVSATWFWNAWLGGQVGAAFAGGTG